MSDFYIHMLEEPAWQLYNSTKQVQAPHAETGREYLNDAEDHSEARHTLLDEHGCACKPSYSATNDTHCEPKIKDSRFTKVMLNGPMTLPPGAQLEEGDVIKALATVYTGCVLFWVSEQTLNDM